MCVSLHCSPAPIKKHSILMTWVLWSAWQTPECDDGKTESCGHWSWVAFPEADPDLLVLPALPPSPFQPKNPAHVNVHIEDWQGVGIAQWLECWIHDWKVAGLNLCWSGARIFFSRVDFLCWLLFQYPFHPRVTAVARKRSQSFCQKCRLQLNTHTPYVCDFAQSDMVHGCMLYTGHAPIQLQFHVAPAMPALQVHHFGG